VPAHRLWPSQAELNLKKRRKGKWMDNEISPDAERAGMLAALHAIVVGTLSTLKRKGLLTPQEIDQLFDAGLSVFERAGRHQGRGPHDPRDPGAQPARLKR
jgi:hypothetical protein